MREREKTPSSREIAIITLVLVALAGIAVPPSLAKTGLSPAERNLEENILTLLLVAFGIALVALTGFFGSYRVASRRLALLSLALTNVAGFLSGRYGVDGAGTVTTLLLTSPLLAVIGHREIADTRRHAENGP